jgi:hypothetical protein
MLLSTYENLDFSALGFRPAWTFVENGVSFGNRKVEAIACFPIFDPILEESTIYPVFSSRSTDTTAAFLQDFNATLLEGNSKTFL